MKWHVIMHNAYAYSLQVLKYFDCMSVVRSLILGSYKVRWSLQSIYVCALSQLNRENL